jgi:hypothetical protein
MPNLGHCRFLGQKSGEDPPKTPRPSPGGERGSAGDGEAGGGEGSPGGGGGVDATEGTVCLCVLDSFLVLDLDRVRECDCEIVR